MIGEKLRNRWGEKKRLGQWVWLSMGGPRRALPLSRSWCHLVGGSRKNQADPHHPLGCLSEPSISTHQYQIVGHVLELWSRNPWVSRIVSYSSASPDHCAFKMHPKSTHSSPWPLPSLAWTTAEAPFLVSCPLFSLFYSPFYTDSQKTLFKKWKIKNRSYHLLG